MEKAGYERKGCNPGVMAHIDRRPDRSRMTKETNLCACL